MPNPLLAALPGRLPLSWLLLPLLALPARAQVLPALPQNPLGLGWQQVRTPHFRVIYPAGLDTAAQRTARQLESLHGPASATLGISPRPIGVVLQNQTTVSNGFVTFLPRHAEFFTTPEQGQGLGTVDWLTGLAVHEYRHVAQFDKARTGIGRILNPLLGDGALGIAAIGVPQWFFEGDAVGTETALTRSGRGRIPAFNVGLRANLLSGQLYNYQKAVNGSLRDQVPNWYVLGYFMTSYLKAHHGPDVWARALDRYYKFPFYPFSFSRGIRQTTGLKVEQLYARTMHEVDSVWRAQQAAQPPLTPATELAGQAPTRVFTQYQYPQYTAEGQVLALKTGLDNIAQLVLLSQQGVERRVFTPGLLNVPEMLSVAGGRVLWPEFRSHPRYGQRVYSELKVLDLASRKLRRLGTGGRFAAASLSPDGRRIVAVRTDVNYRHSLVLLDADTGAELQTLPNPANDFYQQPRFLPDGRRVVAVVLRAAGKTLQLLDPAAVASGASPARNLLPVANINLTNPQPWGEYVLYNSPQSGVDNIYAVSLTSGQTFRITSRPFGAYHAAVSADGRRLAFHDVRATGARIAEMPLDPATWTALPAPATASAPTDPYAEILAAQEPAGRRMATLLARPDSVAAAAAGAATAGTAAAAGALRTSRYRPLAHALNVFSYGLVQSPTGDGVSLGLRSQDLLNTTQAFAGLSYDQTERTLAGLAALSYQALPVVLDAAVQYGGRDVTVLDGRGRLFRDQWRYTRLSTGLRLPLNLTRSKFLQALNLSSYYLHERVYGYDLPGTLSSEPSPNQALHAVQTQLSYVNQLKLSARDVAPRGGGTLLATWRTTPFATRLQARQVGVQGSVFLPGVGRHHALRLRGGYQWQDQARYQFGSTISFPRGANYFSFDRLRAASVDYSLPLAFPHLSLGRLLYVQRLRATVFGDVARGEPTIQGRRFEGRYRNVGLDAAVLFNVLRLRTPLEAGVRVVYDTYRQDWTYQFLAFDIRI